MSWKLTFISEEEFTEHVRATIQKYGDKLESFDLRRFNKNIVDPVKLIFDKTVYRASWEETISNEIFRQRDKSNNNDIGYFHQRIFQYIKNCHVPPNGEEGGWDVIYSNPDGIKLPDGSVVHTVYVEMKNKHNTMNSSAAGKTFIKMQNQLLNDDDCACFLVEAIAKKSQNIKWETTVDKKKVGHRLIRRVSMDQFYALVTGQPDAFYQICMVLPEIIERVVDNEGANLIPNDTVYEELKVIAGESRIDNKELAMAMAVYMLGFSSYVGFQSIFSQETLQKFKMNERISEYARQLLQIEQQNSIENIKCANCGEENPEWLHDEGDTVYCLRCLHRTRKDNGEDDLVVCPVCHHMRDRKAVHCMWCNSAWGCDDTFDQASYELANEFEASVTSANIKYYKLKGRRK